MDKAEHVSLARRVGHMPYEQVQQLFDENKKKLDAHAEALNRGEYCPACKWHLEQERAQCDEVKTLQKGMEIYYHQKGCSVCQTVVREWKYPDSCEYSEALHNAELIYIHRMSHLERKKCIEA